MKVGIGLPTMLAGTEPALVLEWARRADAGGVSTLSTGELLTTASYDAIVALSAVAAVTEHARLMTNVLVVPLHNAGVLAKQAATLDKLSLGRLTLGIGVGGRKPILYELTSDPLAHANYPDFASAPAPYEGRGGSMRATGRVHADDLAGRGTDGGRAADRPGAGAPRRPRVVVRFVLAARDSPRRALGRRHHQLRSRRRRSEGGQGLRRRARGMGHRRAHRAAALCRVVLLRARASRAAEGKEAFLNSHYAHLSDEGRQRIGATIQTTTAAAVRAALRAFADVGADEVLFVPMMPALDQVDRVVELLPID